MTRRFFRAAAYVVVLASSMALAHPCLALEHFDFEGPYLTDPGHTIKDHALFRWGGLWHCFYIRGLVGQTTSSEVQLGHAVSEDLRTWELRLPALTAGPELWDERNVWAPMVLPQDPRQPGSRLMLYTGANPGVNQRMGFAASTDINLAIWTKDPLNPILQPISTEYIWDENGSFSAFRDPFYFFADGKHQVLSTAKVHDATLGGGSRGAVHRVTSTDFENWTEEAPLLEHNGPDNVAWHEIESVQLHQAVGMWFLFFTESNELGTRWIKSPEVASGWDMNQAVSGLDFGIAAELTPVSSDRYIFTRHTRAFHTDGSEFWVIRADSLTFNAAVQVPVKIAFNPLAEDWVEQSGSAFLAAPTFGDNSAERGEAPTNPTGHGYIGSKEFYSGPISNRGIPGSPIGGGATGTMKSRTFTLSGDILSLRVGGGDDPNCFVALVDASNEEILFSASGTGTPTLSDITWDISPFQGQDVYLWIEDASTQPDGYINVDEIREELDPVAAPPSTAGAGRLLANVPNPFNPTTQIRFELDVPGLVELTLYDLRGREVWSLQPEFLPAGLHSRIWRGKDTTGKPVASGVYSAVLRRNGVEIDRRPITLVR